MILDIQPGSDTPYYYSSDGVLETYVRVGNESVKASAVEQKRLILKALLWERPHNRAVYKSFYGDIRKIL